MLPAESWAQTTASGAAGAISVAMLKAAATLYGLEFTDAQLESMLRAVNQNVERINTLHTLKIPNDVSPPFYFSPLVPSMQVERTHAPLRFSKLAKVQRPSNLEDLAFWSIRELAQLIQSRQVSSLELTQMYLQRLHRLNPKLNCVVTFLDEVALAQARQADAEIAEGRYKGPLHGIPWGAKDIIAVKGHKTTWGSGAYQDQMIDLDASVVEKLREAGAVLLAKLTTGELAGGDRWFGGRTNNPWNLSEGSSGSSAGPASATAAGLLPFAIGTETGGSIISPSARCGATGLRPTFGRVSRYGVMALSWTQDRLGPICRSVEDCAVVMSVIAQPDGRDLSVTELPFQYDATLDIRKLRVGYFADAFADDDRAAEWRRNEQATLDQVRSMGFDLMPLNVPEFPLEVLNLSVEAAVFFDELLRSGRDQLLTNKDRAERFRVSRLVPAVEYLQSQRMRSLMMQELAKVTANVDVYLAPSTNGNPRAPEGAPAPIPAPPPNKTQQHYQMANLACYPAVALPNGFTASGSPTSMIFMARPYAEGKLLAFAKAYQDATAFHLKHPLL